MLTLLALALAQAPQPSSPPEAAITRDSLMAALNSLPTARAARGDIPSQQGLAATEDLLIARLKEMGYQPDLEAVSWNLKKQTDFEEKLKKDTGADQPAVDSRGAPETTPELASREWHNIIVEIKGTDLPREVLLVSAHFDAVPNCPGADDDGSGTAALLETARVLKGQSFRRTVRLIFFNLEEIGLVGSKDYVRAHRKLWDSGRGPASETDKEKLVGMVSLEMLGYFSDEPGSQRSPIPKIEGVFDPPTVGDFIGVATVKRVSPFAQRWARAMHDAAPGLKVVTADMFPIAPPDFLRSDHAPFLLSGQPALMLTDTSNFRNAHYHQPTDTVSTIDPARFTLVAKAVAGAIRTIANAPDEPPPPPEVK